jgi:fibronectin type 3 domain-containing protein
MNKTFKSRSILTLAITTLFSLAICIKARAFTHPSVPGTLSDLEAIKAKVQGGEQPWKAGYDAMAADWTSDINYTKRGAEAVVSRNPNSTNLSAKWRPDMVAAYNQARMWYFTGNTAYAQKAHDILLDWATVQTNFDGMEANLDLGDYAYRFVGAAEILRGTWPGWTQADTDAVKALFTNVYWPPLGADLDVLGPTNKGSLSIVAAVQIAIFCDDQAKLDRVLYHLRYTPATGFINTLSNGEHGETGRDEGHSYNHIFAMAEIANALWNQGIDVFSHADNRLLAMGEYYARENLLETTPYVPMGTTDEYYTTNWSTPGFVGTASAFNILRGAYVQRKGMSAPFMERKLSGQPADMDAFMWLRPSDSSTATPLAAATLPAVAPVGAGGFSDKDIGTVSPAGSSSYTSGTWTVVGSGTETWTHNADSFHFTYKAVTGDCTIIAKVESVGNSHPNAKAGLMIRSGTTSTATSRLWVAATPQPTVESYMHGWTQVYGGSNWEKQSYWLPQVPYWLKIERVGNVITAYASQDGTSWATQLYGRFDNMPATAFVGLIGCAYLSGTTNTSTFSHVNITTGSNGVTVVPEAPAALQASPGQQVPLRWTASFGATGYIVKRGTSSGGPYTTIGTETNASYVDTTAVADTTYYYVVTGSNSAGEGPASAEESVTARKACVNLSIGGTASADTNSSLAGSAFDQNCGSKWYGASGTTGALQYDFGSSPRIVTAYDIITTNGNNTANPKDWQFQGSNYGTTWTTLDTQTAQDLTTIYYYPRRYHTANSTAYRYYRLNVTANNGGTGLELSELTLLGPADLVPVVPTGLSSTPVSATQINLSWTTSAGATGYDLLRGSSAIGPFTIVATGLTGTTYSNAGLAPGTTYYYVVRAASTRGVSANSTPAGAVTSAASGNAISVDFQGGSASNGTPSVMDASESAGAVSLANWNNASGASGSASALKDYTGAATAAGVTWSCNNIWSTAITESAGNYRMMKGYIDTSNTSTSTVTVSSLPSAFTSSGYTVYVYCDGDNGTGGKIGKYTIGATTINATDNASTNFAGTFTQANGSAGNYVAFGGLTGSSFTLTAQGNQADSGPRAPINAIQIVATGTGAPVPPTPTGGAATAASITQLNITWNPVGGATSYNVKRATSSGGPYATIATGVTGAGYSDTGLTGSTTYYYVISAVNSAGESANSSEFNGTTLAPYAPTPITPYTQIDGGTWVQTASASVNVGQTVKFGPWPTTSGTWSWTGPNGFSASTREITLANVQASQAGNYMATFTNEYGVQSSQVHTIAIIVTPAAPTGFTATAMSGIEIYLSWTSVSEASSYNIKRATSSGGPYTTIATGVTATNYSDTNLTPSTGYYYVISAVNSAGESANSAEAGATTASVATVSPASVAAQDGYVLESSSGSGVGGSISSGATSLRAGDDNSNRQYKSVVSFDTSTIPDDATITSAVLKLTVSGTNGTTPFSTHGTCYADIKAVSGFNGSTTLETADFQAATDAAQVAVVSAPVSAICSGTLNAAGRSLIEKTGTTQLRVYFSTANNGDSGRDYISWSSGEGTSAVRPVFQITYTSTVKPPGLALSNRATGGTAADSQNSTGMEGADKAFDGITISGGTNGLTKWYNGGTPTTVWLRYDFGAGQSWAVTRYDITSANDVQGRDPKDWQFQGSSDGSNWVTLDTRTSEVFPARGYTKQYGLTNATRYRYYRLNVTANYGGGSYGVQLSELTLMAYAPPATPVGVAATESSSQITVGWNATVSATSYTVRRSGSSGGTYSVVASGLTGTSWPNTGLADGATWYYTVAAVGFAGESAASAPVSATTYTAVENWRLANFGTISNSGSAEDTADPDGDGWSNDQEFASGTNPNDRTSLLKVGQMQESGNDMVISFATVLGKTYRVERSDTLQGESWVTVQDSIAGTGGTVQVTDAGGAVQPKRFFRVVVQ